MPGNEDIALVHALMKRDAARVRSALLRGADPNIAFYGSRWGLTVRHSTAEDRLTRLAAYDPAISITVNWMTQPICANLYRMAQTRTW